MRMAAVVVEVMVIERGGDGDVGDGNAVVVMVMVMKVAVVWVVGHENMVVL